MCACAGNETCINNDGSTARNLGFVPRSHHTGSATIEPLDSPVLGTQRTKGRACSFSLSKTIDVQLSLTESAEISTSAFKIAFGFIINPFSDVQTQSRRKSSLAALYMVW